MHHPPVTGLVENATNVWDEIANIHISQGNDIRKFVALLFFSQRGSGFSSSTITNVIVAASRIFSCFQGFL